VEWSCSVLCASSSGAEASQIGLYDNELLTGTCESTELFLIYTTLAKGLCPTFGPVLMSKGATRYFD